MVVEFLIVGIKIYSENIALSIVAKKLKFFGKNLNIYICGSIIYKIFL